MVVAAWRGGNALFCVLLRAHTLFIDLFCCRLPTCPEARSVNIRSIRDDEVAWLRTELAKGFLLDYPGAAPAAVCCGCTVAVVA